MDMITSQTLAIGIAAGIYVTVFITLWCVFMLLTWALELAGEWGVFKKAGECGWKALVPFLSEYTYCKIVFGSGWFFLLLFVPFINIAVAIAMTYQMCKLFGKGIGFTILTIFLPFIGYMLLGWDEKYIFHREEVNEGEQEQS